MVCFPGIRCLQVELQSTLFLVTPLHRPMLLDKVSQEAKTPRFVEEWDKLTLAHHICHIHGPRIQEICSSIWSQDTCCRFETVQSYIYMYESVGIGWALKEKARGQVE